MLRDDEQMGDIVSDEISHHALSSHAEEGGSRKERGSFQRRVKTSV